ncbi:hypothetical protein ACV3RS_15730 [Clostridium perfringens]|uniref:hypothetical protein n=1 Tax=Bacillota TaxID=1239 RepID=UPI001DACA1E5|nr:MULTISPECIES: hypothetical protein [Bacillota]EGT3601576.1 hypothetical protein [Clostridium perfringens]EHR0219422.1 hypothetical protein [Clostridium perfringens]MDK0980864.1 hypothetical protein [Clostridium perfringens]MDU3019908.1 hypothetical protein [Clostridium perfringens]MDU5100735.1 hypothetical protein [Peptoniphilus grossensis]
MKSFYDILINISFMVVCGSDIFVVIIFLSNMIKREMFCSIALESFIITSIVFAILCIVLTSFRSNFYTKTQLGRTYSIKESDK